ncbi:hypothetical protein [Acinetobacter haemolyticus]|uniref:hypothetical protein n=1 Tax=Acinetobacter haemolyticus TaxID=29430 RepID=UPI003F57C7EC
MLAVNEGHAFCNEMIFKFKLCKKINNDSLRNTLLSIFEKDFEKLLNSSEHAEYNILLKLCHIHFKGVFCTEEILNLTSIILGFTLDCDDILLTSLSHAFDKDSYSNKRVAQALIHDMRRGHSRHFLAFKLIIVMYLIYNDQNKNYQPIVIKIAKNEDARKNLSLLLEYAFGEAILDLNFLKEAMFNNLINTTEKYNNNYILKEIFSNRTTYPLNNYIIENLNDYKTLSFLLSDDTIIKLKNSINLDIENYFLEDLDESFSILNDIYDNVKKFHMNPYEVEMFLNGIRQQYQNT